MAQSQFNLYLFENNKIFIIYLFCLYYWVSNTQHWRGLKPLKKKRILDLTNFFYLTAIYSDSTNFFSLTTSQTLIDINFYWIFDLALVEKKFLFGLQKENFFFAFVRSERRFCRFIFDFKRTSVAPRTNQ